MMEEVVIRTCLEYDIDASRDEHFTGVWVSSSPLDNYSCKKVAAVGVTASKWITTHGFALNVNPDLSYFDTANILPCGIEGRGVTSIEEIICVQRGGAESEIPTVDQVASVVLQNLQDVFGIELEHGESLK
jgi:lipoyl(octanoyl) transferase